MANCNEGDEVGTSKSDDDVDEDQVSDFHYRLGLMCSPDAPVKEQTHGVLTKECSCGAAGSRRNQDPTSSRKVKSWLGRMFPVRGDQLKESGVVPDLVRFKVEDDYGSLMEGSYLVDPGSRAQTPHGFFRKISHCGDLEFYGCFLDGRLSGTCFRSLPGGGLIVSSKMDLSENTAYLYPDCRTAMVGRFGPDGRMLEARAGEVAGTAGLSPDCYRCQELAVLQPRFSVDPNSPRYRSDRSTASRIASDTGLQDPYERYFVEVRDSAIPNAGEGLFAKVWIAPCTVVAFYNGVRSRAKGVGGDDEDPELDPDIKGGGHGSSDQEASGGDDDDEDVVDEDDSSGCYRLKLSPMEDLDIPPEMASLDNYSASLAHKICHSFTPNCEFDDFEHPRFGNIKCVVTIKSVDAGEELTAHYKYDLALAPTWYKKQWAGNQKNRRRLPDWQAALDNKNDSSQASPMSAAASRWRWRSGAMASRGNWRAGLLGNRRHGPASTTSSSSSSLNSSGSAGGPPGPDLMIKEEEEDDDDNDDKEHDADDENFSDESLSSILSAL